VTQDRSYDALLVDLDGTLLDDQGQIRPRNVDALHALENAGVHVMIATGRSSVATLPVVTALDLHTPMLVFNGAGIYCPQEKRLIEERILSNRVMQRAYDHALLRGYLVVAQQANAKFALAPRDAAEEQALGFFHGLETVEFAGLPREYVIRLIFYSNNFEDSADFRSELTDVLVDPLFLTDFPLNLLVSLRSSPLKVVDVHPPSRGKAEGLRFLKEVYGVPAERTVAIGDASNDIQMLQAAGLGVAMQAAGAATKAQADRIIGDNNTDTIADLVSELFGVKF
jgi:Cof subfamily protein (haloacid dehalogenase superfamily)